MNARWVVLLHMTADKRLAPYAAGALKKLRKLPASSGVEVAVELDMRDGRKPKRFRIDGAREVAEPSASWTYRPRVALRDFVDWGLAARPRARAALVVWGEGGGWIYPRGLYDEPGRTPIDVQLKDAIAGSKRGRVDVLGFDACLMSMVEILYGARGLAKVQLASETFTPLTGWPYAPILEALARRPGITPRAWAESVAREVGRGRQVSTLAVWDAGRADAIAAAFRALAASLRKLPAARSAEIARARAATIHVGNPLFVDAMSLLRALERHVKERAVGRAAAAARREIVRARTANATVGADNRGMGGLSIFFPDCPTSLLASYRELEFPTKTGWGAFLASYLPRAAC